MRLCALRQCFRRSSSAQCWVATSLGVVAETAKPTISWCRPSSTSAQPADEPSAWPASSLSRQILNPWRDRQSISATTVRSTKNVRPINAPKISKVQRPHRRWSDRVIQVSRAQRSPIVAVSDRHKSRSARTSLSMSGERFNHRRRKDEEQERLAKAIDMWIEQSAAIEDSPAALFAKLHERGQLTPRLLYETLQRLLKRLDKRSAHNAARPKPVVEREMLRIWHFTATSCDISGSQSDKMSMTTDFIWPAISNGLFHRLLEPYQRADGVCRIRSLWPDLSKEMAHALFLSAVNMFAYFVQLSKPRMQDHVQDFIAFGSRLLYKARTHERRAANQNGCVINEGYASPFKSMRSSELHSHILIALQLSRLGLSDAKALSNRTVLSNAIEEYFINDLGRMHERGTYARFDSTWAMAQSTFGLLDHYCNSHVKLEPSCKPLPNVLTRMFLLTTFRSHNLDAARRIWEYMCSVPRQRNVKDWTAMIHGLGAEGDISRVERLWQSMIDHAVEPDTAAWNARIQANLLCGRFEDALQMLSDMSEQCLTSNVPHAPSPPFPIRGSEEVAAREESTGEWQLLRPSTRTLNTALTAIRNPSLSQVNLLLKWASSIGISFDVCTYNSLLNIFAKLGDRKSFSNTLTRMRKSQVKPDGITFNLLVEYSVDTNTGYAQQAIDIVVEHMQIMRTMELQPSYALLARLLESLLFCGDLSRAQGLLEQSKTVGRSIHARLCAIMAKGLFKHSYADTSSIESMVNDIDDAQGGIGSDFYDAAIQGLAARREMARMQAHFTTAARLGIKLSWRTLYMCLKESISTMDDAHASEVIRHASQAVMSGAMSLSNEERSSVSPEYEHQFWLLADEFKKAKLK